MASGLVISKPEAGSAFIKEFEAASLHQGKYLAAISMPATESPCIEQNVSVRWLTMPLSLTDLDFAIGVMKYYASEEEYDDLRSGSRRSRIKKFEDFWKKHDPTPETGYNEFMAEYFRRVDIAFVQFRTVKEENGANTDRGKIFILYGTPSNVERSLEPNRPPRELWIYETLHKKFTFEDPSRQGNYKLIETESK